MIIGRADPTSTSFMGLTLKGVQKYIHIFFFEVFKSLIYNNYLVVKIKNCFTVDIFLDILSNDSQTQLELEPSGGLKKYFHHVLCN